jgi:phosphomannomutase
LPDLLVSVSGVRGIVGESLTPEVLMRYSAAFAVDRGGGRIVVGSDGRRSRSMVTSIVTGTLLAAGCDVVDVGVAPTPTIALSVLSHQAKGGIALTASHNPQEWNAMKFIDEQAAFLSESRMNELKTMAKKGENSYVRWDRVGSVFVDPDAAKRHVARLVNLEAYDVDSVRLRDLKIAVDAVNASGSVALPMLLRELGCEVVEVHCTPTGVFPRNPEPKPGHLRTLCKTVVSESCDLGMAVDPDADRLCLVDETGEALSEEATLAICVKYVLGTYAGPVVVNLSTSKMIEDIADEYKVKVTRTRIGEVHVATALRETNGVIGGEGNGGVILPASHYGRDSLAGAYLVVGALVSSGKTISDLAGSLPHWTMVKKKVACPASRAESIISRLASELEDDEPDFTDGLRVDRGTSWIHIRRSNTEPVVRVHVEARSSTEAEFLCDTLVKRFK